MRRAGSFMLGLVLLLGAAPAEAQSIFDAVKTGTSGQVQVLAAKNAAVVNARKRGVQGNAKSAGPAITIRTTKVLNGLFVLSGGGANVGVSVGEDGVLIIDAKAAAAVDALKSALAAIDPRPPRIVLDTNWHFDHADGNEAMAAMGAAVVAHPRSRPHMLAEQRITEIEPPIVVPAYRWGALPVVTLDEPAVVHFNGDEIAVIHVPAAHSDGDLAYYFRKANVLFTGDLFFPAGDFFIHYGGGGTSAGMVRAADRFLALANEETRVVPGHGPVCRRADIVASRAFMVAVRERIQTLVAKGQTVEQVVEADPLRDLFTGSPSVSPSRWARLVYEELTRGDSTLAAIDAAVEQGLKAFQVPGLALAVVRDGQVVLARGYGVRSLTTREAVTPDTLFYVASGSKSFTATLIAMTAEEGKVNWDRPIRQWVPAFQLADPTATGKVTLRDLLSHRTGIPRQELLKSHAPERRTDLIDRIRHFEPAIDFRSGYLYCNETVTVAGDLVAREAGATWEELIRLRIFEPLGMARSAVTVADMKRAGDYAFPYIVRETAPEEMAFYDVSELRGPAGGVISSVNDLSKWLLFNLNGGKADGKTVMSAQALAQLWVPQVPATRAAPRYPELSHQNYGLGWFIDAYRGSLRISHPGNLYGFTAMISFLPREKIGVAVLANLNGTPLAQIIERGVYDALLGLTPIDWPGRFKADEARLRTALAEQQAKAGPGPKRVAEPSRGLEAFAGVYTNPGYGTIRVRHDGKGLVVVLRSGTFPLRHSDGDSFEYDHPVEGETWRLAFRADANRQVAAIAMDSGSGSKPIVFNRGSGS